MLGFHLFPLKERPVSNESFALENLVDQLTTRFLPSFSFAWKIIPAFFFLQQCHRSSGCFVSGLWHGRCFLKSSNTNMASALWWCWYLYWSMGLGKESYPDHGERSIPPIPIKSQCPWKEPRPQVSRWVQRGRHSRESLAYLVLSRE